MHLVRSHSCYHFIEDVGLARIAPYVNLITALQHVYYCIHIYLTSVTQSAQISVMSLYL